MTASVRRLSTTMLVCILSIVVQCTTSITGGGTGDETVVGKIVTENGEPAVGAEVTLLPYDYDPVSDRRPSDYGADTTDRQGRYAIILAPSAEKRYTLQAVHLSSRTRTIIPDIDISGPGESTLVAVASLHETGSIKVIFSDSLITGNGYVFIPGTNYHASMENGYAMIDSVPAETIPQVYYSDKDEMDKPRSLTEKIDIQEGIPTIVTSAGSAYAMKLFLNTTPGGADVSENVYEFPLLIRLSDDNFNFNEAGTDGSDLRFTKSDNTPLPFEIERWDAAARRTEIWVKIDTVYGNDSSRFLVMYWGEPASAMALDDANVFDTANGFKGVWHLAEEAAGVGMKGVYKDATGLNDGDDFISATDRSGIIGYGHAFDGIDDFMPVNSPVTNFLKGDVTIALWVNINDSGGTILSKLDTSPKWNKGETSLYFGDGTDIHVAPGVNGARPSFVGYSNDYAIAGQPVDPGNWHHLVFTRKWNGDSTGTTRYFIDGKEVPLSRDSLAIRSDETIDATLRIGQPNNNESYAYFNGLMDELEISAVARSAEWIKLNYMCQSEGKVFVKY